jgi:predicted metal-dependent phosphotriesterase family hydrolase
MAAAGSRIQGIDGDFECNQAGMTLAHEHLYAAYGAASGDVDLDFTCDEAISADLTAAHAAGVCTVVEVTTQDMGGHSHR